MPPVAHMRKSVLGALFSAGAAFAATAVGDQLRIGTAWRILAVIAALSLFSVPWLRETWQRATVAGIVSAVVAVRISLGVSGVITGIPPGVRSWVGIFLWMSVGFATVANLTADQEIRAKAKIEGEPGAIP